MVRRILTPKQSLNKAYQKVTVFRDEFNLFRKNLTTLLSNIDHEESEENVKNHLKDFLNDTYYKDKHLLNTKNKTDLVIYLDNKQDSKAGVLIEVKRSANKAEMITKEDLNRKALHELILYYLQERIEEKNDEIKYLIATNIYEWFIFDAVLFENLFYKNTQLVKDYNNWKNDRKVSSRTDHFYNEIAKPFLDNLSSDITFTHLDLNEYKKLLNKTDNESERKFIPLYKILSPVHLLKQPFANDSNSLDRNFYNELLHIIGLKEVKVKNKKLINRKSIEERDPGSFVENTIQILKTDQAIDRIKEPVKYGEQVDDQLYHVALELSLTWINRILFLKLLESQLFNYHKSNDYKFLNSKKINDYDELYKLFHQVLAVRLQERADAVKYKYTLVPYLNSSLFEISDLENQAIRISQLDNNAEIKIYKATVLKDKSGKKRTGTLTALEYLFEFLDAYNFTSEGKEEIEEEKKTLINASVLGLIFEKINGYKDGSYFTPGFITMYMCRETIRRAVVQKFNEKNDWKCETFEDLKNHLADRRNTKDILEANEVINSLKICDPAVGSGHFLVSALNEIIAIKSELGILADETGVVLNGYDVKIENDELIVTYNHGEELFEYHPPQKRATINQQVQETLFREKQTIIETCLFGVDINPNSVSIARLRLWIELLKNAYYTKESNYTELETLPNIDINIKEGNSLVSRFKLTEDIFSSADKTAFEVYKMNVNLYKNEHNREKRKQLKTSIDKTRERIKGIGLNPVKELDDKISIITEKLHSLNKTDFFEEQKTKVETEKFKKKRSELNTKLENLIFQRNNKLEAYKILYSNALEWRFEFPEVVDENGKFTGFDVVLGNPPYGLFNKRQNQNIALEVDTELLNIIKEKFPEAVEGMVNASKVFYALGLNLISHLGFISMIIPFGFLTDTSSKGLRQDIFTKYSLLNADAFPERDSTVRRVFEDAKMSTCIVLTSKAKRSSSINLGVSFNRSIEYVNRVNLNVSDLRIIDDELLRIPLCNQKQFDVLKKIYTQKNIFRLKLFSNCLTGEVDITLGKKAITNDASKSVLIKGAQIDRYILKTSSEDISQGEIEYLDEEKFELIYNGPKLQHAKQKRIILQGLTGVNERVRIKSTLLEPPAYLANSANYIVSQEHSFIFYLIGLLNSKLLNFCFKCLSTSSNVNGYEIDELPIMKKPSKDDLSPIVEKIINQKKLNSSINTYGLESEIDAIVYKLYGLTEEEIRIVEGSTVEK